MMDDKDGQGDIPDINYASIYVHMLGPLLFDPSRFVSDTLHFAAGDKWRRCVCMNIMKAYRGALAMRPNALSRRGDDIIIMKHVISQSVNCTESKDGWACPGKSDAASNIPEGVVKPGMGERRGSFINGY